MTPGQPTVNWHSIVFDPDADWLQRFERLAMRRFPDSALAQTAASFVLEKLSEQNWKLLSGYTGRSRPDTYLYAMVGNLLEDFARSRFGRVRPPAWLSRLGGLWLTLFRLLCMQRLSTPQAIALVAGGGVEGVSAAQMAKIIKAKIPRCGEYTAGVNESLDDPDNASDVVDAMKTTASPVEEIDAAALDVILILLECVVEDEGQARTSVRPREDLPDELLARILDMGRQMELTDMERIVLRIVFKQGEKVSVAARILGQPEHKVRRQLANVLERMRAAFERAGFTQDVVQELLRTGDAS